MADDPTRALYAISVAAQLTGLHPQSIRSYEDHGLVEPARSAGGTRRYSDADITRLSRIGGLLGDGLNLAGIEAVLALEASNLALREELAGLRAAAGEELVVLLDDAGQPIGSAPKRAVHHASTPLHLAFSCWVQDEAGRTLLTRRASAKQTWPGAWTNSVCGHPAPGESVEAAVRRRARQELGLALVSLQVVLPDFRYRATMDDGTVENEVCPVFVARSEDAPELDPAEVAEVRWSGFAEVSAQVEASPAEFSPWMILQLPGVLASQAVAPNAGDLLD